MIRSKFKFDELEQLMDMAFVPAVVDEETGEILQDEFIDESLLDEAGDIWDENMEGCLLGVQKYNDEANAIGEKIKVLQQRKKQKERRAEKLKEFCQYKLGGNTFETEMVKVSYRKSQKVELDEGAELFLPTGLSKVEIKPDKTAIKKRIKAGETFEGVRLVDTVSMIIK